MARTHQTFGFFRKTCTRVLLLLLFLPLTAHGQGVSDTLQWDQIRLSAPAMKILPASELPEPHDLLRSQQPEMELRAGIGSQSASFGQLSEWVTDSLISWFYSQPEPLERLFTALESEIGFLPEPIAYESSSSWQASLMYSRWMGRSIRAGAGLSAGMSSLKGSVAMQAFPFYSETYEPQSLTGQLSGKMLRTGLFAEASWYASGGERWRPLAGISSAWHHISWRDTQLQVAGINFILAEPEAVNAFSGGVHAGGRWQSGQRPLSLEARLFYKHLFTGYGTSVTGLRLSLIMR